MLATKTIAEEILDLKQHRKAMILAHHYQDSEIQEIADAVGDSLELARQAQRFQGDVLAFCGVWFMAETAKVLNPQRIVVVPDRDAGCSLVDSCPVEQLRAWRQANPGYAVVAYIKDRKSTRLNSSHQIISYAVFCLKKKKHLSCIVTLSAALAGLSKTPNTKHAAIIIIVVCDRIQ